MNKLTSMTPDEFCSFLEECGIPRFFIVWADERQKAVAFHPHLEPLAQHFEAEAKDFDRHKGAFVHRTCRGQGAGGVRFWSYDTVENYLQDGLRHSKAMSQRNALTGIWWGGGKEVMSRGTGGDPYRPRRV